MKNAYRRSPDDVLIELQSVHVEYRGKGKESERVLHNVSAKIHSGDAIALLGPSGSGKTTLLKVIAGQQPVSGGNTLCYFDAEKPGQFGYVSQSNSLFPWLTVYENIRFPLTILRRNGGDTHPRIERMLREVGLQDHGRKFPRELSGGMARRAVLARTLIYEPRVLLLDEPFGGLDTATRYKLVRLLIQLRKIHDFTQVCVEHDVEAAAHLSEKFWVMSAPGAPLKQIDFSSQKPLNDSAPFSRTIADRVRAVMPLLGTGPEE